MPRVDLVKNADLGCPCPPPPMPPRPDWPPVPPMPPDYPPCPCPPYPPYPPYPPVPPCPPEPPVKKNSIEEKICKYSKKAAAIERMIDNFENKGKDAIINIGDSTYNFGAYKDSSGEVTSYGTTIDTMLHSELTLIKTKITELAAELGQEVTESGYGIVEKTVTSE